MDCHVRYYVFANMQLESALPGLVISAFLKGFSFNVLHFILCIHLRRYMPAGGKLAVSHLLKTVSTRYSQLFCL